MTPVKAGIIGFGRMAECNHLPRMQESELYDVVGVFDITATRRALAEEQGLRATESFEELLSWEVELVLITTHTAHHHEAALRAAAAGKHMLIEKPLAVTESEAQEMVDAARENGVVLSVYHNRHFDADYRMVKAAQRDGLLGDLVTIENRTMGSRPAVGFGTPDYNQQWRVTAAAGGGTLLDFGPHWIEQILDLMGERKVVQVWGDVRHFRWGDADDHFRIEMVFDNGTRAVAAKTDIAYCGLPYKWLVVGTEATLRGPMSDQVVINGPDFELKRSTAVPVGDLHANVAKHLREGADLIVSAEHALRVMKVIQAGVDSSKAGRSLDVEI